MKDERAFRRGEIYLADLGTRFGSEQGGIRPVLILQNNLGNIYCPTLIVAPLTTHPVRILSNTKTGGGIIGHSYSHTERERLDLHP